MSDRTYPVAPNGIFWTLQGEGHLRGFQMVFVRLAGCSVGCPECDTDYSVARRMSADHIASEADEKTPKSVTDRWVWITGGEPADHGLRPLINALRKRRFAIAVAASGHRRVIPPVDWLSVSPHDPDAMVQTYGNELKLVDGLHGLDLEAFYAKVDESRCDFMFRYVQPLSVNGREDPASLKRCLAFLRAHPNWSLSRQDHLSTGMP